jgi:hypothetical protein
VVGVVAVVVDDGSPPGTPDVTPLALPADGLDDPSPQAVRARAGRRNVATTTVR